MNMLVKSLTVSLLAASVAVGGASVATAKPELCKDISVPVRVRLAEGCFLPDSGPALPPGDATFTPPATAAPSPVPFSLPTLVPVPPGPQRDAPTPAEDGE